MCLVTLRSGFKSTGKGQSACLQGQHILWGPLTKLLAQSIRKEGRVCGGGRPGHTRTSHLAYQDSWEPQSSLPRPSSGWLREGPFL